MSIGRSGRTTPPRILVIGDIVSDILAVHSGALAIGSDTAARISITGGGSAANTAAWLAAESVPVDLIGVVGTDPAGTDRLAELTAQGVGCATVRRSEHAPTGTVIVLANAAERSMLYDRGANLLLATTDVDAAFAARPEASHLHVSGYALLHQASRGAGRYALAAAAARGMTTSVDAASAAPLRLVGGATFLDWVRTTDLLLANLDEARALWEPVPVPDDPADLTAALAGVVRRVVVKQGAAGAVWAGPAGERTTVTATPTNVIDPTGAGDAFAAGLLTAWLAGANAAAALAAGARLGARAVSIHGGRPASPRPASPAPSPDR